MLMQQSLVNPSFSVSNSLSLPSLLNSKLTIPSKSENQKCSRRNSSPRLILCCSDPSSSSTAKATSNSTDMISTSNGNAPPVVKKRKKYRKLYPGEKEGITEELRFVAMRLRNLKGKKFPSVNTNSNNEDSQDSSDEDDVEEAAKEEEESKEDDSFSVDSDGETWKPSVEGFVKYLVDSQLVFNTIERIIEESNDVAYAYFRKTGLERAGGISNDLEWFSEQGIAIPEPSTPGISYANYLEELAERSAPLFLSHFYNIYFSHIAGGQVIAKQVSKKILEGRELELYKWEGDAEELLKGVREKLNILGEHWTRDARNKCLKEATKSFKFLGQIIRLIILETKSSQTDNYESL